MSNSRLLGTASIDVTKIQKHLLYPGKNGAKYLKIAIISNRDGVSQYGDTHFVVESLNKEQEQAGEKGSIIGNFREYSPNGNQPSGGGRPGSGRQNAPRPQAVPVDEDVPF